MNRFLRRALPLAALLIFLLQPLLPGRALGAGDNFNYNRARLLSYLLREQLPQHHYSHKPIDDTLSKAAFGLYLKQLDSQKRFLLKDDVKQLDDFADRIDDELKQGRIVLPSFAAELMGRRIADTEKIVKELLAGSFDLKSQETFESDPEKLDFCTDQAQLRERWRQALTYQVLLRYLGLVEDRAAEAKVAGKPVPAADDHIDPELLKQAQKKVAKNYDDFFNRLRQDTLQDYYDRYFSAITRAYDPHTDYMPPMEKEDFDIGMRGSLEGIGATLREEDGYIKVVAIMAGSAAFRQGQLQAEDTILKVAQGKGEPVDITDMRLRDAVSLIRGPKGTEVRLTVRKPDGRALVIPIVRDVVQIEDTFVKGTVIPATKTEPAFGYIKIPSFYRDFRGASHGAKARNVTDDVRHELDQLKQAKISGIVLDLRNDGGGSLADAVETAGLFIKTGPVVQVRSSDGTIQPLDDTDPGIEYSGPLVVLVNEFSASASEILAGMLQDYGRAVIVGGQHTHGKGTVQALIDLDRGLTLRDMDSYKPLGALKITVQKFYRVSGASTQYRGVVPDIILPDRLQYLKTGEKYAEYSLPWDTVAAVNYTRWPHHGLSLDAIRARSRQRTATDPKFIEIAKEAALAKERSEQTRQSLNIDTVRTEMAEAKKMADLAPMHGEKKKPAPDHVLTAAEKEQQLADNVLDDPYASEALAILGDLQAAPHSLLSGTPGRGASTASAAAAH